MLGDNPSPYVLTFVVFVLCCLLTNFMSNTATTALMAPICMSIAQGMGADPRAVLMACVIGGSCAYATPIGMPANTMVVGAGGYTFMDYVKAWVPVDYHCYSREHDYLTNCISFFPVRKKIVFIGNDLNETYTFLYKSCIYKF